MNIVDDSYKTLREEGYEGSKSDLVYKKLRDLTGLSSSTPDMWYQWLRSLGYNGSVNDMLSQHLVGKGYGSSLQDALALSFSNRDLYYANEGMTALFDIQRYINVGVATNFEGLFDITRASSKYVYGTGAQTGQLVEVPAGQPAYQHDPVTGAPLGLSVEGSATNYVKGNYDSSSFFQGQEAGVDISITGTGNEKGFRYIEFTLSGTPTSGFLNDFYDRFGSLFSIATGSDATSSVFVRFLSATNVDSFAVYVSEHQNSTFIGQTSKTEPVSNLLASDYERVSVSRNIATGNEAAFYFLLTCQSGTPISSTFRVAVPQIEVGSRPTSPIYTEVGTTATRAADIVTSDAATFGDWFNASEGTFVVEWDDDGFVPANDTSALTILSLDNGDSSPGTGNFVALQKRSNGFYNLVIRNAAGSFISVSTGVAISEGGRRGAISFDGTDAKASVDGSAAVTATNYRNGFTQSSLGKLADLNVLGSVVFENLSFQPEATL